MPHEVPECSWQVVTNDCWDGHDFVTIADYNSRHFEVPVYRFRNTLADTVIQQIKVAFLHHGIPEKLVSDNEPQYSCDEFA